jgi:hypothetical protein
MDPTGNASSIGRQLLHERRIQCRGYRRDDGLWEIEAELLDTKTYVFENHDRGEVRPGEPVHRMWLRLTLDDDMVIRHAEARTDYGPYSVCPQGAETFARLQGMRLGPGFRRRVDKRIGGVEGCTHLRELLGPAATTAFQTIAPVRARERGEAPARSRPALLGSCRAYAPDGDVVKRIWPEHYQGED